MGESTETVQDPAAVADPPPAPAPQESAVDIHMPKAVHGWREFVNEISVIVVGVSIALVAEQSVVAIHERTVAAEARASIRAEVSENLWWINRRAKYQPCIEKTIATLGDVVTKARAGQATPVVTKIVFPLHSKITALRWDANSQAGRTSLFSGDEQQMLGNMYYTTEDYRHSQEAEELEWAKIGFIEQLEHYTAADERDLSIFLAEVRYYQRRASASIIRAREWARKMNVPPANFNTVGSLDATTTTKCPENGRFPGSFAH